MAETLPASALNIGSKGEPRYMSGLLRILLRRDVLRGRVSRSHGKAEIYWRASRLALLVSCGRNRSKYILFMRVVAAKLSAVEEDRNLPQLYGSSPLEGLRVAAFSEGAPGPRLCFLPWGPLSPHLRRSRKGASSHYGVPDHTAFLSLKNLS